MQLRFTTDLTSDEYVKQQGWQSASLERCPLEKGSTRCVFCRHGTYGRAGGYLVVRYYCRTCKTTFSLLPEFLAARLTGTLAEVEHAVATAEVARTQEAAAMALRPDIEVAGALRWLGRRKRALAAVFLAVVTLYPDTFSAPATLTHLRSQLGPAVLVQLRAHCDKDRKLHVLAAPVGFCRLDARHIGLRRHVQHKVGADPPT